MDTPHTCAECGIEFTPGRPWALFCSSAHQRAFWKLQAKRGAVLAPFLVAGAEARRYKNAADRTMAAYARQQADAYVSAWVIEDRTAGRSCASVVRQQQASGKRAVDVLGA